LGTLDVLLSGLLFPTTPYFSQDFACFHKSRPFLKTERFLHLPPPVAGLFTSLHPGVMAAGEFTISRCRAKTP
jgi:hypothetical protein